jgi:hypothetical protein
LIQTLKILLSRLRPGTPGVGGVARKYYLFPECSPIFAYFSIGQPIIFS